MAPKIVKTTKKPENTEGVGENQHVPSQEQPIPLIMNEKHFLHGLTIDVADLKEDAIGRNLLKRLERSGVLPFFTIDQETYAAAYIDQFYRNATEVKETNDEGEIVRYIKTRVAGFPMSLDFEDIADILDMNTNDDTPMDLEIKALDSLAKRLVDTTEVTNVARKYFDEVMYHISHLV
ncbi:hypothetical protein OROMI_016000 [Orobanche minor]